MKLIFASEKTAPEINRILGDWAAARIWPNGDKFGEPYGTMAVQNGDGALLGAVVFHNWNPEHGVIEISAAADLPKWLTKRSLRQIFEVCFEQHKCQLVCARMDPFATKTRSIFKRYGFTEMVLPRFRGKSADEILCTLTVENWRSGKWGKEKYHAS